MTMASHQFPVRDIRLCNQPPRSTQPGHPFVGRWNEYQSKGGDGDLRLGSKDREDLGVVAGEPCDWSACYTIYMGHIRAL